MKVDSAAFIHDMRQLETALHRAAHDAVEAATKAGEEHAKATTLYKNRTGNLRRSTVGVMKFSTAGELRAGEPDAPYAQFVENGRPFMHRAGKEAEKVLDHGLEYYVDQAIARG